MTPSTRFVFQTSAAQPHQVVSFELAGRGRTYACVLVFDRDLVPYAYRNLCPHWSIPLSDDGNVLTKDRERVYCRKHGAEFELSTGLCVAGPCEGDRLKALKMVVSEHEVEVTMPPMIIV